MTALCGGGASEPKPGYNDLVYLGTAAVEAFLALKGFGAAATLLAPALTGLSFALSTYCSTDPPADPGLTAADIADALNFTDVATSVPAIDKIRTWFLSQYWYDVCQCSTTSTPAPPSLSDPGPVSVNPGLPGAQVAPCYVNHASPSFTPPGTDTFVDLGSQVLPAYGSPTNRTVTTGGFSHTLAAYPIPPGVTGAYFVGQYVGADYGAIPNGPTMSMSWFNSTGSVLASFNIGSYTNRNAGPPVTWTETSSPLNGVFLSGTTHWAVEIQTGTSTGVGNPFDFKLDIGGLCSGDALLTPCCPPDPSLDFKLAQILGMLTSVYQAIPTPIHSLSEGTAHASLSGNGNFSIAGTTIAARIDLTTIPGYLGVDLGDPLFYFDAGYVTAAGAEGPYASERVTFAQQVFWLPTLTSSIHYSLAPGIVATITELSKGP